jgi:HK97 family phage major capsid protein
MPLDRRSELDDETRERQHHRWFGDEDADMQEFRKLLRGSSEHRDLTESVLSVGGYFVPYQFHEKLIAMMKAMDRLFDPDVVLFVETEHGGSLQIPQIDDTGVFAVLVGEGGQSATADLPSGNTTLAVAPTWRSRMVKASMELVQDSGYPLEDVLTESFAKRLARGIGAANVAQLLSVAQLGTTAVGSSGNTGTSETGATSIGSDDLEALIASVDEAYLISPKCRWLMTAATRRAIFQVKDKTGRPVFHRERNAAGEVLLLDYPVAISPSMPQIGASNKPILFGDLGRFLVRVAKNATRLRIHQEQFALYGQVAYEMFLRSNATLALAIAQSDSPVKYLQNSAT